MSETTDKSKEKSADLPTAKALQAQAKADTSWKREPVVDDDGYEIRTQRVQNADGTYSVIKVKCMTKRHPAKSER